MLEHVAFDLCAFFSKPRLSDEYAEKSDADKLATRILARYHMGSSLSSYNYARAESREIALLWLDEMLNSAEDRLNEVIDPFQWSFFQSVSQCLPHIEYQLRGGNEVFLVTSGSLGYELFLVAHRLMSSVRFVYIFYSQLTLHGH